MQHFVKGEPLKGSRKIYVDGSLFPIRVGMREIVLSTGKCPVTNPDVVTVYDTSGPFGDADASVDLTRGVLPLREGWIEARGDTLKLEEVSSEYGRARLADESLSHLRFGHVNKQPRK